MFKDQPEARSSSEATIHERIVFFFGVIALTLDRSHDERVVGIRRDAERAETAAHRVVSVTFPGVRPHPKIVLSH